MAEQIPKMYMSDEDMDDMAEKYDCHWVICEVRDDGEEVYDLIPNVEGVE